SVQGLTQQRIAEQLGISRLCVNRWGGGVAAQWPALPGCRRPACSVCGRPVTSSRICCAPSSCPTTSALKRSSGTSSGSTSTRPDKALVLCCDEKSQCQALERTQPGLPLGIG